MELLLSEMTESTMDKKRHYWELSEQLQGVLYLLYVKLELKSIYEIEISLY